MMSDSQTTMLKRKLHELGTRAAGPDLRRADWGVLFCAIKAKLRLTVGSRLETRALARVGVTSAQVRAGLMDSMAALDRLQVMLTLERRRCQRRLNIFDAQAALALALKEFTAAYATGMRAGIPTPGQPVAGPPTLLLTTTFVPPGVCHE